MKIAEDVAIAGIKIIDELRGKIRLLRLFGVSVLAAKVKSQKIVIALYKILIARKDNEIAELAGTVVSQAKKISSLERKRQAPPAEDEPARKKQKPDEVDLTSVAGGSDD